MIFTWNLLSVHHLLGVALCLAGGGLPSIHVLLLEAPLSAALPPSLSDKVLDPGPSPGVHHMAPVTVGAYWQLLEPLDQKHTGIADFPLSLLRQVETFTEVLFVLGTRSEPEKRGNLF